MKTCASRTDLSMIPRPILQNLQNCPMKTFSTERYLMEVLSVNTFQPKLWTAPPSSNQSSRDLTIAGVTVPVTHNYLN